MQAILSFPVLSCGDPGNPPNGAKSGNTYTFDSVVSFSCDEGYTLSGESTIKCVASGNSVSWNAPIPTCTGTESILKQLL